MAGIAADFGDFSSGEQRGGAEDELATVARLDPARVAFESYGAGTEREPAFLAQDQLDVVGVASDHLAVLRRVVLHRRRVIGIVGPLAKVHAVRTPFQDAAAHHAAAFFKVETIQERGVERSPGGRAEVEIPVHVLLGRFGLGAEPTRC